MFRVAKIPGKGRGLVASTAIPAGTVIERAAVVKLDPADRAAVDRTALFAYTFVDPEAFGSAAPSESHGCLLAFGNLTFCNHSAQPNAVVRWTTDDIGQWASLEALRSIAAGEEITLYYTNIAEYSAADLFI